MKDVFLVIPEDQYEVLEKAAKEMNVSVSDLIRDAVRDYLIPKLEQ